MAFTHNILLPIKSLAWNWTSGFNVTTGITSMLPDHEPVQVEENYYTSSIRTNSGSENLFRFKEKPHRRLIES